MSEGSFLIVPEVPSGFEFGIDTISYELGPKFKGISLIPKGLHFIYHNVGFGMKQGFFILLEPSSISNDILICPWNHETEEISPSHSLSEASILSLKSAIMNGQLNDQLGPYPFAQHHNWINLSNFITKSTLHRTNAGPYRIIYGETENSDMNASLTNHDIHFVDISSAESYLNEHVMKNNTINSSTRAEMLTKLNIDKSELILYLIQTEYNKSWHELLAEFQLSFLLFVLLYSLPALNQWKKMFSILCQSESLLRTGKLSNIESNLSGGDGNINSDMRSNNNSNALVKKDFKTKSSTTTKKENGNNNFTVCFLRILYVQLNYTPTDFFTDELSKDNFLTPALSNLFSALTYSPTSSSLSLAATSTVNTNTIDVTDITSNNNSKSNNTMISPIILENKKRLLIFIQKRFHIFEDEVFTDGNSKSTLHINSNNNVNNSNCIVCDSSNNSSSINAAADMLSYESYEDIAKYTADDDMPVIVTDADLATVYGYSTNDSNSSSSYASIVDNHATLMSDDIINNKDSIDNSDIWSRKQVDQKWSQIDASLQHIHLSSSNNSSNNYDNNSNFIADNSSTTNDIVTQSEISYDNNKVDIVSDNNNNNVTIDNIKLQEMKYSWRYPLLYDEMKKMGGSEDYIMTAMRILDECNDDNISSNSNNNFSAINSTKPIDTTMVVVEDENDNVATTQKISQKNTTTSLESSASLLLLSKENKKKLLKEAVLFIENEASHLTYDHSSNTKIL